MAHQVSKWRLQFKEAEARLAELTGDKSGDVKRIVWGMGDEERFRGELDEKVVHRTAVVSYLFFSNGLFMPQMIELAAAVIVSRHVMRVAIAWFLSSRRGS